MLEKFGVVADLLRYMVKRKKFWLIPLLIVLLIIGLVLILGQATGLGPLIYPFI